MNKFLGEVKNGKLRLYNAINFENTLLKMDGKKIMLSIEVKRKLRSTGKITDKGNQNGFLWGVVYKLISEESGFSLEEVNNAIKYKFLRIGGSDEFPKIKSTKELNTIEFENLIDEIRVWALDFFNINIPTVESYYDGHI